MILSDGIALGLVTAVPSSFAVWDAIMAGRP
jgi:hypothetical protein